MPATPNDDTAAVAASEQGPRPPDRHRVVQHLLLSVTLLSLLAAVLGLLLVQRVGTTYRDGLEVTADGAAVAALGATSAEALAQDIVLLADAAGRSIDEAREFVLIASTTSNDLGDAFATNIADGVTGTSSIADDLASFIEAIERFIPGNRDSLAEDLRKLSDGLDPVPEQLRALGEQLQTSAVSLEAAAVSLDGFVTQLEQVEAGIDEARLVLVEVEALSGEVAERAQRSLDRSDTDLWLVRLLVVVLGIGFAGASIAAHRAVGLFAADAARAAVRPAGAD
jgi:hypothetical protein